LSCIGVNTVSATAVGGDQEATYSDGEHLVYVGIDENTLPIWGRHEVVPVAERLESIVNHNSEVTLLGGSEGVSVSKI
jgi:hypothetical protein